MEKFVFEHSTPKTLLIKLNGNWDIPEGPNLINEVTSQLSSHPGIVQINLSISQELKWDSGRILFLLKLIKEFEHKNIYVARQELPQETWKLPVLALKAPQINISSQKARESFLDELGGKVIVLPDQVAVPKADQAFNADGSLKDAKQQLDVQNVGVQLAKILIRLGS